MSRAIVVVPAGEAIDEHFATWCQEYATHRGYRGKTAIIRDWDVAEGLLLADWAQVIIVARREYLAPGWRPWSGSDIETTQWLELPSAKPQRHLRLVTGYEPLAATMDRVGDFLDGDGPIPAGLDPESMNALRRIARALRGGRRGRNHR